MTCPPMLRSLGHLLALRTVLARILCVLVLGLLLIQVGSFSLVNMWNERDTRARMLSFMSADVVFAYHVLLATPESGRQAWLHDLNRGFYTLSLGGAPTGKPVVRTGRFPPLDEVAQTVAKRLGRSDVRWVFEGDDVVMAIPLSDTQTLYVNARDPFPPPNTAALVGYLMIITLAVSIVGVFAVRIALAPMRRFIRMAQRLGRDICAPPLVEDGLLEARRMAKVFNHMQARLRRQMDQRVQIVAAISHDLQTPVTRLRLRADAIDDATLRQRVIADLDQISELVRDALGFVRSAAINERHAPVDLNAMVDAIVSDMIDVGKNVGNHGYITKPYLGARRALHRGLQNIIENALKFGTRAEVRLAEVGNTVHIWVRDNGPGIPSDMLEMVFEPFLRIRTSENAHLDGSGLGLSITRNLISAHGGKIVLTNHNEGGLEAHVILPRPEQEADGE